MENIRKIVSTFLFGLLLVSAVCLNAGQPATEIPVSEIQVSEIQVPKQRCVMTVFVHGTTGISFSPKNLRTAVGSFFKKLRNKEDLGNAFFDAYDEYKQSTRRDLQAKIQPLGEMGLQHVELEKDFETTEMLYRAQQTARLYKYMYDQASPEHTDAFQFYLYNWKGSLNSGDRLQAAKGFYLDLLHEQKRVAQLLDMPVAIHLVAHSHGCNVVLNLAAVEEKVQQGLYIERVVFLAGPVQSETERYIQSPIFGKKYNFYSKSDPVQVLDILSTKDFFSRRAFGQGRKPITLPSDLCQLSITIGKKRPSHNEFWSWWCPTLPRFYYDKKFSLCPVPLSVVVPFIVALADQVSFRNQHKRLGAFHFVEKEDLFVIRVGDQRAELTVPVQELQSMANPLIPASIAVW